MYGIYTRFANERRMNYVKRFSKRIKRFIPIIILILVLCGVSFYVGKRIGLNTDTSSSSTNIEDVKVSKQTIKKTLTSSGEIEASSTEKIKLNTSYKFNSLLVEEDDMIKKGEKIIKYSNGKYLTAPYDLIITSTNLPESKKICNSSHVISVSAYNVLSSTFRVDETKIDSVYIGKTVKVKVPALNDREFEGIVTDITNTATNGKFTATIEFDNDGDVKLGMTINITV